MEFCYLVDESGIESAFEFLGFIEYNSKEYIILLPESSDEVVILLVQENNGQTSYIGVDNEHDINIVFNLFKERHKEEFNFYDDHFA